LPRGVGYCCTPRLLAATVMASTPPTALGTSGGALAKLGRHEEALADYNRSLELGPENPETLANRGVVLGALRRYDEALADHNRSLELQPDRHNTLYNRACIRALSGDYDGALSDLRRAIDLNDKYRGIASSDPGFNKLREDPTYGRRFRELVG